MSTIEILILSTAWVPGGAFLAYAIAQLRGTAAKTKALEEGVARERIMREELERRVGEAERSMAALRTETEEVSRRLGELQDRLEHAEELASVMVPPRAVPNGLNITRRVEVQQRLREGISPEAISRELEVALSEVRLIAHLDREDSTPRRTKSSRSTQKVA